jgi:hypothetical protein
VKSSELLNIEYVLIEEFNSKVNLSVPSVPINQNLDLTYSIHKPKGEEDLFTIRLKARTIKETQLAFFIQALFGFRLKNKCLFEDKNTAAKLIVTMVSISYSTLRGILLRELPFIDLENRVLPAIDLKDLAMAVENEG